MKYLLSLCWAACLLCPALAQDSADETAAPAAEMPPAWEKLRAGEEGSVPLLRDANGGQVLVYAQLHGQPLCLILDTGASHSVLHQGVAEKLQGLKKLDDSMVKVQGNAAAKPGLWLGRLRIAGLDLPEQLFLSMDLSAVQGCMAQPVDGILGMDILAKLPFCIDLAEGRFSWSLPAQGEGFLRMEGSADHVGCFRLRCRQKGRELELLLDSGASITVLPEDFWAAGPGETRRAKMADINHAASSGILCGKVGDLEAAGGIVFRGLRPLLRPAGDPQCQLGMDALQGRVLLHLPEKKSPYGVFLLK